MGHRDAAFVAAALTVHAGLAVVARFAAPPMPRDVQELAPSEDIDVEIVPLPAAPDTEVGIGRVAADDIPPDRVGTRGRSLGSSSGHTAGSAPEAGGLVTPQTDQAASPGPAPDAYDPLELARIPGLGGRPAYTVPGVLPDATPAAPAPTRPAPVRPVDPDVAGATLREELRSRDKRIGLDLPAGGTVASTVALAMREANTPNVAHATFEVRIARGGRVASVRVLGASAGAADAWERAAHRVAALLAGKVLDLVGAFADGATITVQVASDVQLPAGGRGGVQGNSGSFDLSNIGAHEGRVVHTSFSVRPGI